MNSSPMPWVKLYTELLDDTKVLRLTDVCRWRFVQLILMAGECDAEGLLATTTGPMSLDDIARRLRVPTYMLSKQMNSLMNVGLVEYTPAGYRLVKFAERQGRKQSEKREQWRTAQQRVRHPATTGPAWASDEPTNSQVVARSMPTNSQLDANSMLESAKTPDNSTNVINDGADREEERREEEEGGAGAPAPRAKKVTPSYPAVEAYRRASNLSLDKALWEDMHSAIGSDPANVAFWEQVVRAWIARGWRKNNVGGMFDYYKRRELPGEKGPIKQGASVGAQLRAEGYVDANGNPV